MKSNARLVGLRRTKINKEFDKEMHKYTIPADILSDIPSVSNIHNWTELCFLTPVWYHKITIPLCQKLVPIINYKSLDQYVK
jgi:hypothetical protein